MDENRSIRDSVQNRPKRLENPIEDVDKDGKGGFKTKFE